MVVERMYIEPVALKAWVDKRCIFIELYDERIISFPAHKFTRLKSASDDDLSQVRVCAQGSALRWDSLDEDISVDGIVEGRFEEN